MAILYMAFHGRRGRLLLADGSEMPLEQLTELAPRTIERVSGPFRKLLDRPRRRPAL